MLDTFGLVPENRKEFLVTQPISEGIVTVEVRVFDETGALVFNRSDPVLFDRPGSGDVVINEVGIDGGERFVELKNVSNAPVDLYEYHLFVGLMTFPIHIHDKRIRPSKCQLPQFHDYFLLFTRFYVA